MIESSILTTSPVWVAMLSEGVLLLIYLLYSTNECRQKLTSWLNPENAESDKLGRPISATKTQKYFLP